MKRKHSKRIRVRSYKELRKEARRVFARWIVNRDKVGITCGSPATQCGHYIHRDCFDFDEFVNHGQCARCNLWLRGNLSIYTLKMIDLCGRDSVDEMHRASHEVVKFSREFLENVITKYTTG